MRLVRLEVNQFRNHRHSAVECSLNSNVFLGNNGEGKTNVLEAISFLCLTKSFYAASDVTALQLGSEWFRVEGDMQSDEGVRYALRLTYDGVTGTKKMFINNASVERLSSVVGEFPIVVLSPENSSITFGSPGDRRKFIDLVISQSSKSYFEDLLEYRKILRQRNKILIDAKLARTDCSSLLQPWNESLVIRGSRIIHRRKTFVEEFVPIVRQHYAELARVDENPGIVYEAVPTISPETSEQTIADLFAEQLQKQYQDERRAGSTLVGPHRDDLGFTINNLELRKFASQGQHKTFLITLKLAEFFYLKDRCRETPLLLLDDVFSELDEHRARNLLQRASSLGQSFITSTDDRVFRESATVVYQRYSVHAGTVDHGETIEPQNALAR